MRRPRGNILLMAIFISIFLFFLSVALVAQNRQDVLLSLTEDHRTRADAAARAGLNLALHVMRTDPDWRARLKEARSEMESGARWRLLETVRIAEGGVLWRVQAEGTSGLARVTRAMVVEEIGLGALPPNARFFAFTEQGRLVMMDGSFRWREIDDGSPTPGDVLAARNGPVFSHLPGESIQDQPVWDYGADGVMRQVNLQIQEGRALNRLELGSVNRWVDIPRPDEVPVTGNPNQPATEPANVYRFVDALTQGTSYQGPSLDWYVLRGRGLVADGKKVYSHARHYFYRGTKATINPNSITIDDPGRQFTGTAVLCYDLETGKWTAVMDTMIVGDLRRNPEVTDPGSTRTPNEDTLGLAGGRLFAFESGNNRSVLSANARSWNFHSTTEGVSLGLYEYTERLRTHSSLGMQDGIARVGLGTGLDPWEDLRLDRPGVNAAVWSSANRIFEDRPAVPAQRIRGSLLGALSKTASFLEPGANDGSNCVVSLGDDLYSLGRIRRTYQVAQGATYFEPFVPSWLAANADIQTIGLVHYDGTRWQLWPGGVFELSVTQPVNPGGVLLVKNAQGAEFRIDPSRLALSVYADLPNPPKNVDRFVPVVDLP